MRKYVTGLIAVILSISLTACASQPETIEPFVGEISEQQLLADYETFSKSYHTYEISAEQKIQIKSWPTELTIDVYFGTWCPDSQREVPRLLKALKFNEQVKVSLIALDFKKSDQKGLAKKAGITHTATFVVKLSGKEIGRIVEKPKTDLVAGINIMLLEQGMKKS
jgi:thiol-disulfide isomerase/thioredoxin